LRCELYVSKGYYVRSWPAIWASAWAFRHTFRPFAASPAALHDRPGRALARQRGPAAARLGRRCRRRPPVCQLKGDAVTRARQGKPLAAEDFSELPEVAGPGAWLSPDGELVAIGSTTGELRVLRGFNSEL